MRLLSAFAVCACLLACKKDPPPGEPVKAPVIALAPKELTLDGAYHAIACGPVTAVWSGNADALKDLPGPTLKSFGVESLAFKFADGTSKGFAPTGQLFFSDWRFDVFSPDCSAVALQVDHFGPYHLVKTADLRGYLEGRVKAVEVQALNEKEAMVHSDGRWVNAETWEFTASVSGGAAVYRTSFKQAGSLDRVFFAPSAPKGLRRAGDTYEVVP